MTWEGTSSDPRVFPEPENQAEPDAEGASSSGARGALNSKELSNWGEGRRGSIDVLRGFTQDTTDCPISTSRLIRVLHIQATVRVNPISSVRRH